MLKIYVAPSGFKYQYEEGTQPAGYIPLEEAEKAKATAKRRTTANKSRAKTANK